MNRVPYVGSAVVLLVAAGCSEIKTEHTMRLETAPFEARLALEGPIEIMMQGPSMTYDGTFVSEEQFDWIDEKKTTGEWVLAAFGQPDTVTTLSDGSEIWRWSFRPARAEGELFHIFGKPDEPEPSHITTIVQVKDGVVIDKRRG